MRAPEFWSTPPGVMAGLLTPAGAAWSVAASLRRSITRPYRALVPVICVGNVVAGGSGKTPVVLALSTLLQARGVATHIVTRGYGGRLPGPVRVDPVVHDATEVGDEALLLAAKAPSWVARNRAAGIRAAINADAHLALLDDGFQNPTVAKDLSLLVIDGDYAFGNNHVIPAGPLREPVAAALRRADAIVLIGGAPAPAIRTQTRRPILRATIEPVDPLPWHGKRVVAFAGIGRPTKFFATLQSAGAALVQTFPFPDHHRFAEHEIAALRREAERADATLVTTAKDWVRLPPEWRNGIELLSVELRWHDRDALDAVLAPVLAALMDDEHRPRPVCG
jgi:tetraacyldisaccharide 4'-kinase